MKTDALELKAVQEVSEQVDAAIELNELELALVGGGCGEIVVA